jgi:hypothetical protein
MKPRSTSGLKSDRISPEEGKVDWRDILFIVGTFLAVIGATADVILIVRAVKEAQAGRKRKIPEIIKSSGIWIATFVAVVSAALALWLWIEGISLRADTSRYGFEIETTEFVPQKFPDSLGVLDIAQSDEQAKFGNYSLRLDVDLEGGHPNRSKGEVYVDIPTQDLTGKPITVWVYVPPGAEGEPAIPNGIQVFVKDQDWRGEYGTWWDITSARVETWCQVSLTPSTTAPRDGYMAPGFDPTSIKQVGVKVAIGEGSTALYRGPIYIDALDWPK